MFKDHFITILCHTDKSFPPNLWDRLLPQAEHTLNLLRPSRMTPTISSYTNLCSNMSTMQTRLRHLEAHLVPTIRKTWAPHTASGFYIGNAWDHYCCHEMYINDTKHTHTYDTVFFKLPHHAHYHSRRCTHNSDRQLDRRHCRSCTTTQHDSRRHQSTNKHLQTASQEREE